MDREPSLWIRCLVRIAERRGVSAAIGDVLEEYGAGDRSAFWVCRQLLSTQSTHAGHGTADERKSVMLSSLWDDVRYAVRTFRRHPGFAVAAVAPIALGIGINTGIFSILHGMAFRQLPVPASADLVSVYQQFQGAKQRRVHGSRSMFSVPEYRAYRDGTHTLSGVTAYSMLWTLTLGGDAPREIDGVFVGCNYFDVLQVRLEIGRGFASACETADAPAEVVLSHELWTRAFGADASVVGKTVTLNGQTVGVVGVAPHGFTGIAVTKAALFAPTALIDLVRPGENYGGDPYTSWLTLIGRRNTGAAVEQVRAELSVIASQIDREQPGRTTAVILAPAALLSMPQARRDIFTAATVVLAAFGLVLLIACANVANLLLARAAGRTKEIAVRLSMGASRGRLVRQLLTESGLIALAGAAAGSLLAWWSFQALLPVVLSSLPGTVPALRIDATPNLAALGFALGLAAVTTMIFGLVPALQASKPDVLSALKQGAIAGRSSSGWLRGWLVGAQVAVCIVLLISSALLLHALYAVQTVEPGFAYQDVAVVAFDARARGSRDRAEAFQRELTDRIAALPGVAATAHVDRTPLSPGRSQTMAKLPREERWHEFDVNTVSPSYFSLIGIPVVRGRAFTAADLADTPRAAIVTESTARQYWPGQEPVGQTLVIRWGKDRDVPLEIVGVTADAQIAGVGEVESSYVYLPAGSRAQPQLDLLVRSQTEFTALASSIRLVGRELDPAIVLRVNRLSDNLAFWQTMSRMTVGLSGVVSLFALTLASLGVYGVVSYVVSRRRREVGIRMALGASARDVQLLIVRQTLRPVVVGVTIGVIGAAIASQILRAVLFGVSPFDPVAFVTAPLFLFGVAYVATLLPTRQALRVDPLTTLRYE